MHLMKYLKISLLLLAMLLVGCAAPAAQLETSVPETTVLETTVWETVEPTTVSTVPTEPSQERFLLTFVGDCTFGANPSNTYADCGFNKTVAEDYRYPFRNVVHWFENDECTFLNLEGPLTDTGYPRQKKHTFRGPTAYVNILTENAVEAVTIANNHTMDYGQTGYESTVATLRSAGIPFLDSDKSCIFTTKNGLTIGMYGNVYDVMSEAKVVSEISALKEQGCDLVIFAPHWGGENNYRTIPSQTQIGHAAIDAGADIVWGCHPHVLQPIEQYQDGIIYYSLGNFSFGGNAYPKDYDTALLQQEVIRTADGSVTLGELTIVPASISSIENRNNYQPTPLESGSDGYLRVMKKLDGSWTGPNLPID